MISVAMCTYNGERFLTEQLTSILEQTIPPDEIVICDDGSVDHTVDRARALLAHWNGSWRLIENKDNLGFLKNFEKAICLCRGDIIFLSDQDDVWAPKKIEKMMALFQNQPGTALAFHDAELVDSQLRTLYPSFWEVLQFAPERFTRGDFRELIDHNVVQGSACAFRRELIRIAYPFPANLFHDEWLAIAALTMGKITPLPETLMKYRQWGGNALGIQEGATIAAKIKRWMMAPVLMLQRHRQNVLQKGQKIVSWTKRYGGPLIVRHPRLMKEAEFFQKRCICLRQRDRKILFLVGQYMHLYPAKTRALKEYVKDVLAVML